MARRLALMTVFAALCAMMRPALAATPEAVRFGDPVLTGLLYRPEGSGPFPAVVAMHGCGGLLGKGGEPEARFAAWGDYLAGKGFLVLLPDSFGSRGLGPQCRLHRRAIKAQDRVADALAAKHWLQERSDTDPKAISILGWSNGGTAVLNVANRVVARDDAEPPFFHAVAFYPGCRAIAKEGRFRTHLPLLILVGAKDDWTGAEPCRELELQARAAGDAIVMIIYPDAYHDFDHPHLPLTLRSGLGFTLSGGGTAHAGTNPAARADALERVPAFLAKPN